MRIILLSLISAVLFVSCGESKKKDVTVLKFGHIANESHTWHKAALKFKEIVEKKSNNKIQVKIYPNSTLGKEEELINSIKTGVADMTITGESLQRWAPKAAVLAVPYAFDSSEEMRKAAGSEAANEIIDEIVEKAQLRPITWFERGPRHLTSNKPINTPADLDGLKLRVPNVPLFVTAWQTLGAKPTPMAFSEVFTSLESNTIDAQENPLSLIDSASFFEVQKYVNLTAHVRSWIYIVIGEKKFKGMSEEHQKIIMEAAKEMQEYENKLFQEEQKKLRAKLEKAGMKFIDSDKAAFSKKVRESILGALKEDQRKMLEKLKAK